MENLHLLLTVASFWNADELLVRLTLLLRLISKFVSLIASKEISSADRRAFSLQLT
jgi:hypothetical protein